MKRSNPSLANKGRRDRIWPASIVVFFVVFFGGLVAFIVFASQQRMELVRPDYYEQEIRFQTQLDRIQRARALSHPARIQLDAARREITLQLPPEHAANSSGRVHLYRPADARLDAHFPLGIDTNGLQRVDASTLSPGLWRVRAEWSFAGEEFFVEQPIVVPHS